jgi:glycosyltransferase involved in cell wall biosynthesis
MSTPNSEGGTPLKEKVLHISCGGLGFGGVSSVILSIVENLHKEFDFDCVVFNSKGGREKVFSKYGNLYRINAYSINGKRNPFEIILRPFRLYFGVRKICRKNKYDVIHCHNNTEEGICLLAAKHAGVPIRIAHSHNTPSPRKRHFIIRTVEKFNKYLMLNSANKFVGCSEAACTSFFGDINHVVVYNAVDVKETESVDLSKRNKKTFIHVGRFTYQKNQEFAIRVFRYIYDKCKDCRMYLVGYGDEEEKLKKLVAELELNDAVNFVDGKNADINKYYEKSDYMIFPSRYEGFGIVLIEAQAMQITCFVSEAIQKEADAGLLVYYNLSDGPQKWAEEILTYLSKPHIIDQEMIDSRIKQYNVDEVCERYADIYRGKI